MTTPRPAPFAHPEQRTELDEGPVSKGCLVLKHEHA
jgi:hypothetical protein